MRARSSERRSKAGVCSLAILTICAWTGSNVAALADLTSFHHVTCPEHGELIHLPGPARAGHPPHALGFERHVPAPEQSHGHEHCLAASFARQRTTLPSVARPAPSADLGALALLGRARLAAAPLSILRLAPKSSPPPHLL